MVREACLETRQHVYDGFFEKIVSDVINEGDVVKKGQTLFIVEAMKVMNPITAPAGGKVTKILVENAQPIEFDQPLAIIE